VQENGSAEKPRGRRWLLSPVQSSSFFGSPGFDTTSTRFVFADSCVVALSDCPTVSGVHRRPGSFLEVLVR
jgi:hypothetical protein